MDPYLQPPTINTHNWCKKFNLPCLEVDKAVVTHHKGT